MFAPSSPPDQHTSDSHLARMVSEVTSVATPILAPILGWLDVINSGLATLAALGGLYLLYLNIRRARRQEAVDADLIRAREFRDGMQ